MDKHKDSLMAAAIVMLVILIVVIALIASGSGKSIGAYLLPKDVEAAANKAAGAGTIVDATVGSDDKFVLSLFGSGGLTEMVVRRYGEITVSVAVRPVEFPKAGSFVFRTPETDPPSSSLISREALAHGRLAIRRVLELKGFVQATEDESATLLVRYHAAYDEPISALKLDRLHGYVSAEEGQTEPPGSAATVFKQGSLVIDLSDARSDLLLWRAAAIADVSLNEDVMDKRARVEQAIEAMFKGFPP
jgi:hypothetical protein